MTTIQASSYTLNNLESKEVKLSQLLLEDKINLLLFYNTNCLGCTGRAIPFGYDLWKKNPNKLNLIVVHVDFGINEQTTEEILSIFHSRNSPFPIYRDKAAILYNALNCEGTPHWIVLSEKGEILNSIFGSQDNAQMRLHYMLEE
jgi:peroxiredoxin